MTTTNTHILDMSTDDRADKAIAFLESDSPWTRELEQRYERGGDQCARVYPLLLRRAFTLATH